MKLVLKTRGDYKLYYLIQCATLFSVLGGFICLLLNKSRFEFNYHSSVIFKLPYILLILTFPLLFLLFPKKFPGYQLFISFLRSTAYILTIAGLSLFAISIIYIFKAEFYTPVAAVNFIFSGFCLMYLTTPIARKKQSFHLFILFPIIINSVAITIYFFDPSSEIHSTHATSIINTCMLSLILFTGIAFLLLDKEYGDFFFNKSLKSRVSRHLLPFLLIIPFTALLFKLDLLNTLLSLF